MLQSLAATGAKVPELEGEVSTVGYELYMDAFQKLSTCRPVGMFGSGRIPWTAINEYSKTQGFSRQSAFEFGELMTHMDGVYMDWINRKAKRGSRK